MYNLVYIKCSFPSRICVHDNNEYEFENFVNYTKFCFFITFFNLTDIVMFENDGIYFIIKQKLEGELTLIKRVNKYLFNIM